MNTIKDHQLAGPLVSVQSGECWYDAVKQDAGVGLEAGADDTVEDGGSTLISAPSSDR